MQDTTPFGIAIHRAIREVIDASETPPTPAALLGALADVTATFISLAPPEQRQTMEGRFIATVQGQLAKKGATVPWLRL